MKQSLFINASNIHNGGGKMLLLALIDALQNVQEVFLLVDSRMDIPIGIHKGINLKKINPKIVDRVKAEWWLSRRVSSEDILLCFGNLPPLFSVKGHVVVYLQNRYLIERGSLYEFSWQVFRIFLERLWFKTKLCNADEYVVQTQTMKRLLEEKIKVAMPISIFPFVAQKNNYVRSLVNVPEKKSGEYNFLYVSSGEPHQAHERGEQAPAWPPQPRAQPALQCRLARRQAHQGMACTFGDEVCVAAAGGRGLARQARGPGAVFGGPQRGAVAAGFKGLHHQRGTRAVFVEAEGGGRFGGHGAAAQCSANAGR